MGSKSGNDGVLLTLLEYKIRQFFIIPVSCKGAVEVTTALLGGMKKFGKHMNKVFKSITTDNGLIRRFTRKGHRIDEYSYECIKQVEMWSNALPRKILDFSAPEDAFDADVDMIYALRTITYTLTFYQIIRHKKYSS